MRSVIQEQFSDQKKELQAIIHSFESEGEAFGNQDRNELKLFKLGDMTVNVKSFRIPNIINQLAYRFFRKGKAQRSYEHAVKLREKRIGTPTPVAYFESTNPLLFKRSYYVSEHQEYDLTYRELTENHDYPDHENILRAFTRFTFCLHENDVEFLDHSPGNTLIKKTADGYKFFLVDLNRMRFRSMGFEDRIRNFSRLTPHQSVVKTMSNEYAKCVNEDAEKVFELMWKFTEEFQRKYWRKDRMKKRFKFWRKS